MNTIKFINMKTIFFAVTLMIGLAACTGQPESKVENKSAETEAKVSEGMTPVSLTQQQLKALNIEVTTMGKRDFHGVVEANGHLRVPPQHMASVTAIVGANVSSIKVFLGDKVKKGAGTRHTKPSAASAIAVNLSEGLESHGVYA